MPQPSLLFGETRQCVFGSVGDFNLFKKTTYVCISGGTEVSFREINDSM